MRKYLKEGHYSIDENDSLGKGSFGKVYRAYDHTNSLWVAIKSIDLDCLQKYGEEMKTIICNEITVMRKFTKRMIEKPCPYLVKHFDCFRTDTNVFIVMELCQGGTLNDYLNQNSLNELEVKIILSHLLRGLEYLDDLNISHRDLKPENIFIFHEFKDGKNQLIFKIGDFGFAAQKQTFQEVLGTYPFMAPQIYKREQYTSKVDIWSLGIIAYQLLFKELYFFGKNKWEIEAKVKETPFVISEDKTVKITKQMVEFITLCLIKDKNLRPKASDLLKIALFSGPAKKIDDSIEAIQCQLQYCQFLRKMAQEICDFGNKQNRKTQFLQMYFLKNSFVIINLLTYSIMNKQNYLNMESEVFEMMAVNSSAKFEELSTKIQKEYILISSIYSSKYSQFTSYISRFSQDEQISIQAVINHDQIYQSINQRIYQQEITKWANILSQHPQFQSFRQKCLKLLEI